MPEESVVVVEEAQDVPETSESLSPAELELAKKHNVDVSKVVGEADESAKKVEDKTVKNAEDKESDIPVEDLDSFEKLHDIYQSKPEAFYKLPKNIKNLYHSQKGLYKRMKDEEERRKKVEDDSGLKKIQDSVARIKLDRIKSRLATPEGLTVEELQELIDEQKDASENKDRPVTVKDLEAMKEKERVEAEKKDEENRGRQAVVSQRIKDAEDFANANINDLTGGKYENFDDVVLLAQEMIKAKARYGAQIASIINSEADPQEIVDVLVDIAKLNPKWGTSEKSDKAASSKTDKESVDKLVKNAAKQQTSASLTGGRGSREIHISEDMDPEEALRVWDKIPRDMRHKILKKV